MNEEAGIQTIVQQILEIYEIAKSLSKQPDTK